MPRMKPPRGYCTMSQAKNILNLSDAMVRKHAKNGRIQYFVPEGREQGFYLKKDVDKLAMELNVFLNIDEDEETTFKTASKEDLIDIQRMAIRLFAPGSTIDPTPPEWTLKATEKNPNMKFVLKKDDLLVGYAFIIPFKHNNEKAQKVLSVEFIREVNITPDDIETFDRGKHIDLYIAAVGINPDLHRNERKRLGARLISSFITEIVKLGEKGVIIDKVTARGDTRNGIRLLQAFGFSEMRPPVPGKRAFILNMQESGSPMSLEYQEALRRSGNG